MALRLKRTAIYRQIGGAVCSMDLIVNSIIYTMCLIFVLAICFVSESYEEKMAASSSQLRHELDEERMQHQTHVKEYNRLEQRYENIKVWVDFHLNVVCGRSCGNGSSFKTPRQR